MESKDEERAATPPPEEQKFVDDDGTAYQWDPAQRRFLEMGAPAPSYGVEEMTFAVEPEVIPAMPRKEVRRTPPGTAQSSCHRSNSSRSMIGCDAAEWLRWRAQQACRTTFLPASMRRAMLR